MTITTKCRIVYIRHFSILLRKDVLLFQGGKNYGQRTFTYNRIDLSGLRQRTVFINNETDFLSILDKINTNAIFSYALGSGNNQTAHQGFLLSSDIVNEPINQAVGETREYTLRAHPNSYLYMGALKLKLIS